MIYNIQFDESGIVTDMTSLPTALPDYHPYDLAEMPEAIHLAGYYRLDAGSGKFYVDDEKYAIWLAARAEQPIAEESI